MEAIPMSKKINLSEVTNLVKRGRDSYSDPELVSDILALDASIEGDAFVYESATGNPADDEFVNHKNTWRNRVARCAEVAEREVSIHWTTDGEMVVSLKPVKKKRIRK
jgi:hypothetical protein